MQPSSAIAGQGVAIYLAIVGFISLIALAWIYGSISHRLRYWRAGGPSSGIHAPASPGAVFGVTIFLMFIPTAVLLTAIKDPFQPVATYFLLMAGGAGLMYLLARFMVWSTGERGRASDLARAERLRRQASDPQRLAGFMLRMPLWFFGGLFFVSAVLFLTILISKGLEERSQARWPALDAVVVKTFIDSQRRSETNSSDTRIVHSGHIRFAYVLNGVHHERESWQFESSYNLGDVENRLRAYAPGTHHLIRYRPDDYNFILHQPPENFAQGGVMTACGVFLLIGAGMMWLAHRMAMNAELNYARPVAARAAPPARLDSPEAADYLRGTAFRLLFTIGKVMLGCFGLLIAATGLLSLFSFRETRNWPAASATVADSRITATNIYDAQRNQTGTAYKVEVQFRYTIADAEHVTWVTVSNGSQPQWAQDDANRYSRNSTKEIHYNPANPDDIFPGPARHPSGSLFFVIAFGVFLMIGSGWWIWRGLRATV